MPRKPRYFRPGTVYHLISRFIDHEWLITHERERDTYLSLLGTALADSDWKHVGFALMSNHIHHATIAGHDDLDAWLRRVHGPFAETINKLNDRIGPLFVRGPKAIATPPDAVAKLLAYIHNNPVRAGVVQAASASRWTSHRAYLGLDERPRWLHVEDGLARAGFSSPDDFETWVRTAPDDPTRDEHRRRRDNDDHDELEEADDVPARPDVSDVVKRVAEATSLTVETLLSRRKSRAHALARRAAVHCADGCGISGGAVARAPGISQQRASAILLDARGAVEVAEIVSRVMKREVVAGSGK